MTDVTICDACGDRVYENGGKLYTHINRNAHTVSETPKPEIFDLCHECSDKVRGFLFELKK